MIIEGEYQDDLRLNAFDELDGLLWQGNKSICIDKKQASQLILVLAKWVSGEEIDI